MATEWVDAVSPEDQLAATDMNSTFGGLLGEINRMTGKSPDAAGADGGYWIPVPDDTFPIAGGVSTPTLGQSIVESSYRLLTRDLAIWRFRLTIGSGFSAGSGEYYFNLPILPDGTVTHSGVSVVGDWVSYNATSGTYNEGAAFCPDGNFGYVLCSKHNDTFGNIIGSAGPGSAWVTGSWIAITLMCNVSNVGP